ncbi:MAG: hypothetical protein EBT69_03135 [Verrucomicrobia bacterium]|nr:hypothetical protein [Verrucomicrobiota bacterium]
MAMEWKSGSAGGGFFLKRILGILVWVGLGLGSDLMAYEQAYPMTEPGVCEMKTLPAGVILRARTDGGYFRENNGLFRKLFETIQRNQIPMTTPVEAGIQPGTMVFYLDPASSKRGDLNLMDGVERKPVTERTVASIGIRGGYSRESFEKNQAKLREWLKAQSDWEAAGEAYAVYWNSPFVIWFLKRSEVHLPVRKRGG